MEFREESKVNLLYISSIKSAHSIEEIENMWSIDGDIFETRLTKSEITRLVENRIMKEDDEKFKANFNSQAFIDELKVFLEQNKFDALLNIKEDYLKFIKTEEVRETVFSPEEIKKYYNSDPEEAQKNPMHLLSELAEILFIMSNSTEEEYNLEDQEYDTALLKNAEEVFPVFEEINQD